MIDLSEYLFKHVILIDNDGLEHKGYVDFYESEYDSGYDEPSIGLLLDKNGKEFGIEFIASEIKSIQMVE